jgi:hypothetical protein
MNQVCTEVPIHGGGGNPSAAGRTLSALYADAHSRALIRARYPILYVISSEEMRVQNVVVEIAKKRQKKVFEWSYSTGIVPPARPSSRTKIATPPPRTR